jgi:hypothetical protein
MFIQPQQLGLNQVVPKWLKLYVLVVEEEEVPVLKSWVLVLESLLVVMVVKVVDTQEIYLTLHLCLLLFLLLLVLVEEEVLVLSPRMQMVIMEPLVVQVILLDF